MKQSQCEDIIANIMLVGACLAPNPWVRAFLAVMTCGQIWLVRMYRKMERLEEQSKKEDQL